LYFGEEEEEATSDSKIAAGAKDKPMEMVKKAASVVKRAESVKPTGLEKAPSRSLTTLKSTEKQAPARKAAADWGESDDESGDEDQPMKRATKVEELKDIQLSLEWFEIADIYMGYGHVRKQRGPFSGKTLAVVRVLISIGIRLLLIVCYCL